MVLGTLATIRTVAYRYCTVPVSPRTCAPSFMVPIGAAQEALVRAADETFTNLTVSTPLWQPTTCRRLERIFWVHSPKAASSFSITVCATSSPCVCCTMLSKRDTYF